MHSEKIPLQKYMLWFSVVYILLSAIIGGILIYFDIDSNSPLFIVFIAVSVAMHIFVKDHDRVMNKNEIWRSTWISWVIMVVFTITTVIAVFLWVVPFQNISIDFLKEILAIWSLSVSGIIGISIFVVVFILGINRLAFGVCNNLYSKKLSAKKL